MKEYVTLLKKMWFDKERGVGSVRILLRYKRVSRWRESSRNWLSRDFAKSGLSNPKTDRPRLGSA